MKKKEKRIFLLRRKQGFGEGEVEIRPLGKRRRTGVQAQK